MKNEIVCPSVPNTSVRINLGEKPSKSYSFCPLHLHNEFELIHTKCGMMFFYINGKKHVLKGGDIIIVNSRVAHKTETFPGTMNIMIQFGTDPNIGETGQYHMSKYLSRFVNYGGTDSFVMREGEKITDDMLTHIKNIEREYIQKNKSYDVFIKSSVYAMLGILYRNGIITNPDSLFDTKNIQKILPVLEFIDNHYNEPLTLTDMSDVLNVNESYFCRMFKKITNATAVQYLNFVRVCKAERLLLSGEKSISEISFETGFSSLSYFNRTFKKFKSCTPTDYKKIKYAQV